MWALVPNTSTLGQTLCMVVTELNFRLKIFNSREELLAYCMDVVSVPRQAFCAFWNVFEIGQDGPLSASYQYRPFATMCSVPCF